MMHIMSASGKRSLDFPRNLTYPAYLSKMVVLGEHKKRKQSVDEKIFEWILEALLSVWHDQRLASNERVICSECALVFSSEEK